ncbi:MATE family efflux transporter [Bacilliculturomica massiliensis]|uniref:MATE family efflux transporter n=1 Tax=Bacilliculturomica massiliensis TaxID=1917867 RepID=UPI00102FF649|nr:MATE family efflux transporter [Bacilliculturomica massiliensis]
MTDVEQERAVQKENPLGLLPVGELLRKFAVPSIIAMLVSALYNIVDQFFIGHSVGELGNAATNVAFPLSTSCVSLALLFGIGGASMFNLTMGRGDREKAVYYLGNAAVLLFGCGTLLSVGVLLFLDPLLTFFGSPGNVLAYARTYTGITAFGFPFLILSNGGGHLIRADGSPNYAMVCNISGALINTILDPILIFGFGMGMAGAALATVAGQVFAGFLAFRYLRNCKTVKLRREHLVLRRQYAGRIMSLGAASFFNQIAMMVVQIVMNKSLTYYGALSVYGEAIPLACAGIVSKVGMVFFSVVIGISQGLQPIVSFNYGAGNCARVKQAYSLAIRAGLFISIVAFLMFQIFPRQIISLFGSGSEEYIQFAVSYFRVFLFFTFLNCIQPISSNLFTSIGKPKKGIFLSLTRQILFLLPLILVLPLFIGIDGILYAGPAADFISVAVTVAMVWSELRRMGAGQEPAMR